MEVLVYLALLGLFLFLVSKHQQSQFTKQMDRIIDEAARVQNDLEDRLQGLTLKVSDYDKVMAELELTRQITKSTVPLEMHLAKMEEHQEEIRAVKEELHETRIHLDTSKGKQISERVRLGQVGENLLPFLCTFPYDAKNVRGLFNPIDLLVFNEDEIVFVEVKTGEAKLTEKQRNIKKIIEEGKVRFEIHRINQDGHEIKD